MQRNNHDVVAHMRAPMWSVRLVVAVVGAFLVGGVPLGGFSPEMSATAHAHDAVLHSVPEDGSTVSDFPREIQLEFSGIPRDSFNTVAVSDAATGTVLFSTEPTFDRQIATVKVPEDIHPGDGDYIVGFQITSSDGHATRGKVSFTVGNSEESAQQSPASAALTQEPTEKTGVDTPTDNRRVSIGLGAGAIVLLGVLGYVLFTRRK